MVKLLLRLAIVVVVAISLAINIGIVQAWNDWQEVPIGPGPGYAEFEDIDAGTYTDANAQSVFLVAPVAIPNGPNSPLATSLLNNVLSSNPPFYLLQTGLQFQSGNGTVIWTDSTENYASQKFIPNIPYTSTHTYWSSITYTNGAWYMIGEDISDPATYTVHKEPAALGTHLLADINTAVWVEAHNKTANWYYGFSSPLQAYGAQIYRNGVGQNWSTQQQQRHTMDACSTYWPTANAISGSLGAGGYGYFELSGVPWACPVFTSHLPDIRTSGNWTSSTIIRNNTINPVTTTITYYDTSGAPIATHGDIPINPGVTLIDAPPGNLTGSADVATGQQSVISAVAENTNTDGTHYLADMYPGEISAATSVYVPYAVKNWFTGNGSWRQTTDLIIQNTGTQNASGNVTFYDSWGAYGGSNTVSFSNIPPQGQTIVPGTSMATWETGSNNSLASAVVSANQPLAVTAATLSGLTNGSGTVTTAFLFAEYRAFTTAGSTIYLPLAADQYYTYDSSPQVQNACGCQTTIQTKFYRNGDVNSTLTVNTTLIGYDAINLWRPSGLPSNFLGSAVSTVTSGGPIVAMAEYDRFDTAHSLYGVMQYEGLQGSTQSNVLAYVQKTSPWTYTGLQAQNMGAQQTGVTQYYYYLNGGGDGTSNTKTAPVNSAVNFWATPSEMPADLNGSAVSSSSPGVALAVQVNFDRLGDTSWTNRDGLMGYSAVK